MKVNLIGENCFNLKSWSLPIAMLNAKRLMRGAEGEGGGVSKTYLLEMCKAGALTAETYFQDNHDDDDDVRNDDGVEHGEDEEVDS